MTVRAKFRCNVVDKENGTVDMWPVVGGSPENKKFFKFTPAGHLSLSTVNENAIAQFEEGKEYYVDISLAE